MADAQRRGEQAGEGQHGQDVDDRRLVRRALHPEHAGVNDEPIQAAPLFHAGNFRERDPPVFRGLPHEDVMEWSNQFQRVSRTQQIA